MRAIGAGFGRTGTDSLRNALNILGVGPCHHMYEVMASETQIDRWFRKTDGEDVSWDQLFEGFSATVDWPSARYWPELAETYPEAKIILTYREPESWWNSYEKTILPAMLKRRDGDCPSLSWRVVGLDTFGGRPDHKDHVLSIYRANINRARTTVAPDRYLELELGEGWERLCAFLGCAIPDVPYPSGNTTAEFRATVDLDV